MTSHGNLSVYLTENGTSQRRSGVDGDHESRDQRDNPPPFPCHDLGIVPGCPIPLQGLPTVHPDGLGNRRSTVLIR